MSLLQDMKDLTRQYDDLYKEQLLDNTINNEKEMKDIQFQLFMLTTKQEQEIQNLVDRLNYYKEKYNQGEPVISDEEYDKLYFELVELEHMTGIILENSPTKFNNFENLYFKNLNYDYINSDKNCKIYYNAEEIINLTNEQNVVGIINPEGVTCFLEYNHGYLQSAIAFDKDLINKNITQYVLDIAPIIPRRINYTNQLIIQGKISCSCDKITNDFFQNSISIQDVILSILQSPFNPLNDRKNFLYFYTTNILKGFEEKTEFFYPKMCFLNELGFYLAPTVPLDKVNMELINFIKWQGHEQKISFSTIIFKFNHQTNDVNYEHLILYVCYPLYYKQKFLNLSWAFDDSGNDILHPVLVHTPILIDNWKIRQTFLSTDLIAYLEKILQILKKNPIIDIYRTKYSESHFIFQNLPLLTFNNSTIPSCIPTHCPYCGNELSYEYDTILNDDNSPFQVLNHIICKNSSCIGKQINKLKYFVGKNGLNIAGLSDEIIDWLFEKKWIYKIYDIYTLEIYRKEWSVETNFDKTIVNDLLQAIEDSKKCSFSDFISALGIPLIDKNTAIKIANYFKRYENFIKMIYENNYDFVNTLALTKEQQKSLLNFDYTEADFLWRILKYGEIPSHEKNYFYMPLRQKTYVVVGPAKYFDSVEWLCGYIHGEGGAVVTEVTENVDYVINNDPESDCPENIAARELGIPIITEQEFLGNIY